MFFDEPMTDAVVRGFVLAALGLVWIVALTRLVGLRSFSKMTTFDFVMTVATGSLLAGSSQAKDWLGFLQPLSAMAGLFAMQYAIARIRRVSDAVDTVVQNTPVVLMHDGEFDDAALAETRVTRQDVRAKLREANVTDPAMVRAVVLETTGDISVLHGAEPQEAVLRGTRRVGKQGGT